MVHILEKHLGLCFLRTLNKKDLDHSCGCGNPGYKSFLIFLRPKFLGKFFKEIVLEEKFSKKISLFFISKVSIPG
tara:strand:- start:914 stop:1138 length:225 start_codon:yes stop_codon:yes gene_type:complete